jgi:hypothetical protein
MEGMLALDCHPSDPCFGGHHGRPECKFCISSEAEALGVTEL